MTQLIIFTDLDGTLLNGETYDYGVTVPIIQQLKALKIPVIPVTSKTRAEVSTLRQDVGLSDPFVTENGSGIFVEINHNPFNQSPGEQKEGYYVVDLGCPYVQARAGLRVIANELHHSLLGFGDMTITRLQKYTGLSAKDAQEAKAREFSEPFITPKAVTSEQIVAAVEAVGFKVVVGDRFSHLIGPEAGKGNAVKRLVALYQSILSPGETIVTIGLGNSPNDLAMLDHVDYPIVLPGSQGPHPQLGDRGWTIAPSPAPQGWVEAVIAICQQFDVELKG
ncbi:mannosyl-3-phosphoglycerate phosphatase family [Leptolyngbya sp. Heron Island J]|uniref:HAD-IIB family hydrolase n=1 Tax=Leptolyngbya sp. Heron Island J TaxID=1385935 RepID=UPI0003B99C5F|nr:HAD-IIB family hydrolase [Leptolyngbya sp. Heron Island J]ESA36921.1 mannosyl-3-phosphoglycerate phosphatase family [Leptolyngbya sp. Heron Island J]